MYRRQFKVLVVQDEPVTLYHTVALLKQRDYVVFGAHDVETAGWILSRWCIDLLVVGVWVGPQSGLEFLAAARQQQSALAGLLIGRDGDHVLEKYAARCGATVLIRPFEPALFLMVVAERLASIRARQRWPRKSVPQEVPVSVDGSPARLMDVSYGGFRLALSNERLSSPMTVTFPAAGFEVKAHLVWSSLAQDGVTCLCGAAIGDEPPARWRQFVDLIPQAAAPAS